MVRELGFCRQLDKAKNIEKKKSIKKVILENTIITCIQKAKLFQSESTHWMIKKQNKNSIFCMEKYQTF